MLSLNEVLSFQPLRQGRSSSEQLQYTGERSGIDRGVIGDRVIASNLR